MSKEQPCMVPLSEKLDPQNSSHPDVHRKPSHPSSLTKLAPVVDMQLSPYQSSLRTIIKHPCHTCMLSMRAHPLCFFPTAPSARCRCSPSRVSAHLLMRCQKPGTAWSRNLIISALHRCLSSPVANEYLSTKPATPHCIPLHTPAPHQHDEAYSRPLLQFFNIFRGCGGLPRLPELIVTRDSSAFFITSDTIYRGNTTVATAFRDATFRLLLPQTLFHVRSSTFWFAMDGYAGAAALIADTEARLAVGQRQWAYGADVNPNGTFAESSWNGRIGADIPLEAVTPETCDLAYQDVLMVEEPDGILSQGGFETGGAQSEQVGRGGAGIPVAIVAAATCCAVLFVLLAVVTAAAAVMKRRRVSRCAAMKAAWKAADRSRGIGGDASSHGTASVATAAALEVESLTAGSSVHGPVLGVAGGFGAESACSDGPASSPSGPALRVSSSLRHEPPGSGSELSGPLCGTPAGGGSPGRSGPESQGSGGSDVCALRGKVAAAVQEMQGALQAELQDDHLHVYGVIGRGGFGTVYHGALLRCASGVHCDWIAGVLGVFMGRTVALHAGLSWQRGEPSCTTHLMPSCVVFLKHSCSTSGERVGAVP